MRPKSEVSQLYRDCHGKKNQTWDCLSNFVLILKRKIQAYDYVYVRVCEDRGFEGVTHSMCHAPYDYIT